MPQEKIFDALKDKQAELIRRIEAIEKDFKKGRSQDFSEQTTESENDQVLDEIHHEAKYELRQVNEALHRLENDQYGFCANCDEPIKIERLQALPYTNTCIDCAS